MGKLERDFQAKLIKKLKTMFPGSIIMKNDSEYIQGIPDILILHGKGWAALEVKRSENAPHRPNQDYYINKMDNMSFAAFVYPENEEAILYELQQTLESRW